MNSAHNWTVRTHFYPTLKILRSEFRNLRNEPKDKLVMRDIYRKYIFGDIAGVPRMCARSSAPETEEELCGCDVSYSRISVEDFFSLELKTFRSSLESLRFALSSSKGRTEEWLRGFSVDA